MPDRVGGGTLPRMIGIGTGRRPTSDEPVDELLACHQRIRDMLALALRLGRTSGVPAGEVAAAAARVRRYFVEALPRHVADEEDSLLPRLRGRDHALDAALAAMHDQHATQPALEAALVAVCDELAADPDRHAERAAALVAAASALGDAYAVHLAGEESIVFPALAALPDAERRAVRAEMRARRS
jgi:iron-sulfur cluster repair protein YtfE (RIC family)